ncbi:uncharacterized protein LOC134532477 [Bacillus rossius redtenbacheri]|uniref:uncharacterized protein LOC134532477 n=1 Tax=Bacillus rossius redtenbacheri TaxID=93214 RepID=UPI002FDD9E7D
MPSDMFIPKWLDEQFIERSLQEGEDNTKIQVRRISVRPATSVGDNYCSDMFRVTVVYGVSSDLDSEARERSLIVKALPEAESINSFLKETDAFTTETDVLRRVIPEFRRLLGRAVTLAPRCYWFADKPHQKLVMEDLCESGFQMVQRTLGLDLDHCELAVTRLAMFHAASFALRRRDPPSLENFREMPHLKNPDGTKCFITFSFDSVVKKLQAWPGAERYSEKLQRLGETAFRRVVEVFRRDEDGFNVLNHGDAWKNNMMFRYAADGKVCDVAFVDFQYCYYASPVIDLQYFLYSSPSSEVRSSQLERLVQVYHSSLARTLAVLGCGDRCPSLGDLHAELKRRSFVSVFTAVCLLPVVLASSDRTPDLHAVVSNQATVEGAHLTDEFAREILRLLPVFETNGWL